MLDKAMMARAELARGNLYEWNGGRYQSALQVLGTIADDAGTHLMTWTNSKFMEKDPSLATKGINDCIQWFEEQRDWGELLASVEQELTVLAMSDAANQTRAAAQDMNGEHEQNDSPCRFEWDGGTWKLRFDDERFTFQRSKGLSCLARLLEKPDQSINALAIESTDPARIPRQQVDDDVLTKEAKAACQQRLGEIQAEKEVAADIHNDGYDEAEYARLEAGEESILAQLKAAAGITGRSRRLQAGNAAVAAHD